MQTLGLASEQKPSDGILKRLFWPTIQNQFDVDLVGQQSFWVCVIVAVLSAVVLIITGHVILGLLIFATYALGGMGVRERSITAAALVFLCYLLDKIVSIAASASGQSTGLSGPSLVGLVSLMLLFANVRATIQSKHWREADPLDPANELPDRSTDSFTDRFANQLPARVWPKMRFAFYPLASLILLLEISGLVAMVHAPKPIPDASKPDIGQQIQVAAPQ